MEGQPLRVAITGGASGIGRAIADAFEERGDRVHICGTDRAKLEWCLAERPTLSGVQCDVTVDADVERFITSAVTEFGGLDVLVNNAGIAGPTAAVDEIDVGDWLHTMDVNVNGVFLCTRHAARHLRASHGSIINISSVAGRLGYALRSPYCASKFALQGLTETWARELGPSGVRVNSILPGFVDSPRLDATTAARATAMGLTSAEVTQRLLAKTSLRSKVTEREVAYMAQYLCSPAGRSISGQSISVCANVEYL